MPLVNAGSFRLAAARGDIATLEAVAKTPGFSVEAELGGFTALHAAVVQVGTADRW